MSRRPAKLSPKAELWLLKHIADIAEKNPAAAEKIVNRLRKLRQHLSDFPAMGERGVLPGTRRVVMDKYILTTRVHRGVIEIASIRHARQKDAYAPSDVREEAEANESLNDVSISQVNEE